ncbi:MAG: caspase family protein [Spirochaetales bacterium]
MNHALRSLFFSVLLLGLAGPGWSAPAPSTEGKRFALLIGNSDYGTLGQLKNPANDAADMGKALAGLGFQTTVLVNAELPAMEDAVVKLSALLSADKASTGFFFYAGHGVQSAGVNYLLPARVEIPAEAFLKTKALSAQSVLDLLQSSGNGLNVIVLDACRDNPFGWSRSTTRGLSVVGTQPPGSLIAYATSAGSTAQDGTGRNGVFTGELLKHLATPGLDVKKVFDLTGGGVMTATANKQVPAIYSQYFGDYYLAGAPAATPVAEIPVVPAAVREAPPTSEASVLPPAVTNPAYAVWSWLRTRPDSRGLTFLPKGAEDTGESRTVDGRAAWVVTGTPLRKDGFALLYFDIDDTAFVNDGAPSVEVTVEYYDDRGTANVGAAFHLEYSSAGRHLKGGEKAGFEPTKDQVVGKSKTWRQVTWKLDDARFNRATNKHDFRLSVSPGLPLALASVTITRPDPLARLGGVWYFQGTGAGGGKGPGNQQDTRLVVDATAGTYSFYHYESPATFKSWRKDVQGGTETVADIDDVALVSTLTRTPDVPWGTAQVGSQTRMLYRFEGEELQLWWDWGDLPDPYDWTDYVSYKRTRP